MAEDLECAIVETVIQLNKTEEWILPFARQ